MAKPRPVNLGVQAREKATHPFRVVPVSPPVPPVIEEVNEAEKTEGSFRGILPVALALLLLGLLAVILIIVLVHLSVAAPSAIRLFAAAWLWQESGGGIRAAMAVFL
jgi:hypothetical protein